MYSLLKSCPHKTPWKWKCESESCSVVSDSLWPHGLYSLWNSPGHNTGVGSFSLLQGIFPTQGLNAGLLHCRRILYQLSHQGSPRILEWIAYPFSRGSSWPRIQSVVSCIAGGFFTNWAIISLITYSVIYPMTFFTLWSWSGIIFLPHFFLCDLLQITEFVWLICTVGMRMLLLLLLSRFSRVQLCVTP